ISVRISAHDWVGADGISPQDAVEVAQILTEAGADMIDVSAGQTSKRANPVCLARPHLADPYWTLHTAAELGYEGSTWPKPYWPGRDQLHRLKSRPDLMTGKV